MIKLLCKGGEISTYNSMVARALRLVAIDPAPSLVEALGNMNADH
jgi:hypothetical protein